MSNEAKLRLTRADVAFLASLTVSEYLRYYRALPTFSQVDEIIFNISEGFQDPRIRCYVRKLRCVGIVNSPLHPTEVLLKTQS
jgi:hypothetical protein